MPRKGQRSELFVAGDTAHPQGWAVCSAVLRHYLAVRNFSWGNEPRKRRLDLNHFVAWAEARGLTRPVEITRTTLERDHAPLGHDRELARGKPLSVRCQHAKLERPPLVQVVSAGASTCYTTATSWSYPSCRSNCHAICSHRPTSKRSWHCPNSLPPGLRDRAMLEVFYSTGIRRLELVSLQTHDVDESQGVLTVRLGKGQKDRLVPIGARALQWLRQYQTEVRSRWLVSDDEHTVFLTRFGHAFTLSSVSVLCIATSKLAELGKSGSCHLFRHAMATAMHDNGADIRYLQVMLGHVKSETTQVYTSRVGAAAQAGSRPTHPAEQPPPAPE